MQQQPDVYLESHKQVLQWTKELEFLGYILLEIIGPDGLEERGYYCHQAADLPAIVDTLECACFQPNSRLRCVLDERTLRHFRSLLLRSKQIRNVMAHHLLLNHEKLLALGKTKEELEREFQSAISQVASRYNIQQVTWYPDDTEFSGISNRHTEAIALGSESPLYQRQRILWSEAGPSNMPKKKKHKEKKEIEKKEKGKKEKGKKQKKKKQKKKATEESRAAHWNVFEASLRRKLARMQEEQARLMEAKARKLQALEQLYRQRRQARINQINRILRMMEDEERDQKVQRRKILGESSGASDSMDALFILILLALSSPLWLSGLVVRKFGVQIMR
ncbi:hypothetical protein BO79DRAFT_262578 [Aspergillus costaricaensis CBS 115574]|uniref:Uncharacterized protein n=1 Tax=Aspergillus costaricaensis CBS 115574 TaxID=1448317 RepID=A0ACD1IHP2_9EURO|nr:hypothetical protein BO79DRAFT_262578 [Aspergillus costaricaensis CBS 115574]RAK90089.1 hypothetical protein BO79DRAFT_262578 [Aspergillus costaricaensis CBS 115574]